MSKLCLTRKLGFDVAVEIRSDRLAVADQHDVVPRSLFDRRHSGQNLVRSIAVEKKKTARWAVGTADGQMIARDARFSVCFAREQIPSDRAGVVRKTIPEPELDAVN